MKNVQHNKVYANPLHKQILKLTRLILKRTHTKKLVL